jgi:asparagine synthase (glutamine-hydrolysing)
MERLIAIVNWLKPARAHKTLNTLLDYPPQSLANNAPEFACASSLKIATAGFFSNVFGDHVICDARIDNRKDILEGLNRRPRNDDALTDAELILAAYKQWGDAAAEKIIGDFSFIIWDATQKKVYAARDPMNMRTLYYSQMDTDLCFASDVTALIKHPSYKTTINKATLAGWIGGWPDPDASLFEGIECLPAGHFVSASAAACKIKPFWDLNPSFELRYTDTGQYEEHLHELLRLCVSDRLSGGDSVIASQMSGGMDSTSVTALAHKNLQQQNRSLMVISHSYADTEKCDETASINETVAHLGLSNTHWLAAEQHLNLDFPSLYPPVLESPGTVLSPRYEDEMKLLQANGAKVLLTGSGGDEMCWGHSLTYAQRLKRCDLAVIPEVIRGCKALELPIGSTLLNLFAKPLIPSAAKGPLKKLLGKHEQSALPLWVQTTASEQYLLHAANREDENTRTRFQNPALQARYEALRSTSTLNSVRSYQRLGARYGIDVRHPFFDRRLAEFSFAIPDDLWIRENRPKWLLRRAMDQHLPASVCWNQKKIIFDSFFGNILRNQADTIRKILSDTRLQEMGLLNNKRLLAAFEQSIGGPQASLNVDLLYALLSQIWFQKYAHYFSS